MNIEEGQILQDIENCKKNLAAKNPNISMATVKGLCETVNNILETHDERDIPEFFDSRLHEWFNDSSIIEEIFKTINSEDLCFLHRIIYYFGRNKFFLFQHVGRDNRQKLVDLDTKKYYNDQIKGCKSNLMALPLSYFWTKKESPHATMIVIEKGSVQKDGKQLIEIEHFDSSNIDGEEIKIQIEELIKSLFDEDSYVFRFHHQDEVCNTNIQGRVFPGKNDYDGSCSQFAIWYAFKRLLEPHKKREQIVREMYAMFEGKTPDLVMMKLIKQFQRLIKIKFTENEDKIEAKANGRNFYNISDIFYKEKNRKKYDTAVLENSKKFREAVIKFSIAVSEYIRDSTDDKEFEANEAENEVIRLHEEISKINIAGWGNLWSNGNLKDSESTFNSLVKNKNTRVYNEVLKNGIKPYIEVLQKYEDAIHLCKSAKTKDACELADKMQKESYSFARSSLTEIIEGFPPLIKNQSFADLNTKYEKLYQEHTEMKKDETVFHLPTNTSNNATTKKGGKKQRNKRRTSRRK
jgi:hypothetical protein